MKSTVRFSSIVVGVALLIALGVIVQAQNREKFVISAKAGGVNLVNGNVTIQRQGKHSQEALTNNDNLETGDTVTTGMGGRVEVLLNPGTYLRVDENSEFEFTNGSLENLRVKLLRGSALVEATGDDDTTLSIGIITPQTEVSIVKRGIYRFNVLPNATTEIVVRKGRAFYGVGAVNLIKGGQKVIIGSNGQAEVAKVDKTEDSFDLWSKQRAETLAKANRKINPNTLLTAFNNYHWPDLYGFTDGFGLGYGFGYRSAGYWFYLPGFGGYCFIPQRPHNWSSPYGHSYSTGIGFRDRGAGQTWTRGNNSRQTGNSSSGTPGNGQSTSNTGSRNGSGSWGGGGTQNPTSQPVSSPVTVERTVSPAAQSHIDRASGETRNPN
jgi:hypothetical protein